MRESCLGWVFVHVSVPTYAGLPTQRNPTPSTKPIRRWDDVLAATKKQPLSALLAPHLGYGSAAALGQAAGKTAAQVGVCVCGGGGQPVPSCAFDLMWVFYACMSSVYEASGPYVLDASDRPNPSHSWAGTTPSVP